MHWTDIEKKALSLNIKHPERYSKTDLIRALQRAEGNFSCFGTAGGYCDQLTCCWRKDCLK